MGHPQRVESLDNLHIARGAYELRPPVQGDQFFEDLDDIITTKVTAHFERQTFACELVENTKYLETPTIVGPVCEEVVGPNVPRILGAMPDNPVRGYARASPLSSLLAYLKTSGTPQALHSFVVHLPPVEPQSVENARAAPTWLPPSKDLNRFDQTAL